MPSPKRSHLYYAAVEIFLRLAQEEGLTHALTAAGEAAGSYHQQQPTAPRTRAPRQTKKESSPCPHREGGLSGVEPERGVRSQPDPALFAGHFLDAWTETGGRHSLFARDLYARYAAWCAETGTPPLPYKPFNACVRARGVAEGHTVQKLRWDCL